MTISYVASEARYYGLSTDSKTSISNQEGAKIYYVDTQNTQVCHGGLWYDYNDSTKLNGSLANVVGTPGGALPSQSMLLGLSDGANIQAMRGNTQGTLLASASRTTIAASPIQTSPNAKGVILSINITAAPNTTETLGINIRAIDPVSGNQLAIGGIATDQGSTIQSGKQYQLIFYPLSGSLVGNDLTVKLVPGHLPYKWLAGVYPSGGSPWTYSIGYSEIL